MTHSLLTQNHIQEFHTDGAVLVSGLFKREVELLRAGVEYNMQHPGPYAAENLTSGESGRFFDDYCNWSRIAEFKKVIFESAAAEVAADLMNSTKAQLFHDHVLVKEAGTAKATPWHQDSPYYFVEGSQTVSFWTPLDAVTKATLRCVAGSHLWDKAVLPVRWLSDESFYPNEDEYRPVPDPEAEGMTIKEWEMEPGDAVAFNYKTLHGARGNNSNSRRRAFSLRFVGDDARYVERPGRTSPPFPGHDMQPGQVLREDWFPVIFTR